MPDGSGGHLTCFEVPLEEISHWGSRALRFLDRLIELDLG